MGCFCLFVSDGRLTILEGGGNLRMIHSHSLNAGSVAGISRGSVWRLKPYLMEKRFFAFTVGGNVKTSGVSCHSYPCHLVKLSLTIHCPIGLIVSHSLWLLWMRLSYGRWPDLNPIICSCIQNRGRTYDHNILLSCT